MSSETVTAPGSLALGEAPMSHSIVGADNPRLVCDTFLTGATNPFRFPPPFGFPGRDTKDMTCSWGIIIQQAEVHEQCEAKPSQYVKQTTNPSPFQNNSATLPGTKYSESKQHA
jgi:hypothetical protein